MTTSPLTTAAGLVRQRGDDDHCGLLFEGRQWSWRQVIAESEHRGALLTALRRPGPFHVGVLLENTPEYLFFLAGAAMVGAVVVGINPTRRGAELAADITKDGLPARRHRLPAAVPPGRAGPGREP
jgi:fatty-acyl-CoA synthase